MLKRVSGLIQSDRHTFEVDLEKWPAVRRHSVIEDGISELVETLQNSFMYDVVLLNKRMPGTEERVQRIVEGKKMDFCKRIVCIVPKRLTTDRECGRRPWQVDLATIRNLTPQILGRINGQGVCRLLGGKTGTVQSHKSPHLIPHDRATAPHIWSIKPFR